MTATAYQPVPQDFIEAQRIAKVLEPIVGHRLLYGEEMFSGWFYVVDSNKKTWWVHENSGKVMPCASQWERTEGQERESADVR